MRVSKDDNPHGLDLASYLSCVRPPHGGHGYGSGPFFGALAVEMPCPKIGVEVDKTVTKARVNSDSLRDRITVFLLCVIRRDAKVGDSSPRQENFDWKFQFPNVEQEWSLSRREMIFGSQSNT